MHPVIMLLMAITMVLLLVLPRKKIIIPFLMMVLLAPFGQQLYVPGAHMFVGRSLILVGWIRLGMLWRKQVGEAFVAGGMNNIDRMIIVWAILRAIATVLTFLDVSSFVNQVGFLLDTLGGYFLFRFLIRDTEDMARVVKTLAVVCVVIALGMVIEQVKATNLFGYVGGRLVPFVRDGKIRSQGPFLGPIPAGTFGAVLLCVFGWLWWRGKSTSFGLAGIVAALAMVVTSASSTPLMTVPAGILGVAFWPMRRQMRLVRLGMVVIVIVLQAFMKAPVWMAISHIDLVGGNSAYHRAALIDGFMRHFDEWWLIGVKSTAGWGWDMWDQANQFVLEGETGGLATLICFILILARSFGRLGHAGSQVNRDRQEKWGLWLLGSALFAHIVSFLGISFSDQSSFGWYALLSLIGAATAQVSPSNSSDGVERAPEGPTSSPWMVTPGARLPWFGNY